jgi:hypothetical protein
MSADPVNGFARPALGTILVQRGVLTEAQLNAALVEQQRTGERLGTILVRFGYTAGPTIGVGLATQHGGMLKTEYGYAVPPEGAARATAPRSAEPARPAGEPEPDAAVDEAADESGVPNVEDALAEATARIAALEAERAELLARTEQLRDHTAEEHASDASHLVFAPVGNAHMLFECAGPPPAPGSALRLQQADGSIAEFRVARLAAPPLPGVTLGCAYLVDPRTDVVGLAAASVSG